MSDPSLWRLCCLAFNDRRGAPTRRCSSRSFGLFLFVLGVNGLLVSPFQTFLPIYVEEEQHANQDVTANLRTLGLLGMAVCVFVGGIVTDAFGPKVSILLGFLGTPTAGLLFAVSGPDRGAGSLTLGLAALAFMQGGLVGVMDGAGMATLVTAAPPGSIGAATALYFVSYTGAQAAGNAGAGFLVTRHGFASLGVTMIAAAVPLLLLAAVVLPAGRTTEQSTRANKADNVGKEPRSYWEVIRRKRIWSLCVLNFLRTIFWGATTLALPFLINQLADKIAVGVYSAVSLAAAMVAMLGVGAISDSFDRRVISAVCVVSLLASSLMLAVAAQVRSAALLYVGGTVATAVAWVFSGQIDGPLAKRAIEGIEGSEGRVFGCLQSSWATAMLVGSQLHGYMTEDAAALLFVGLAVLFVPCLLLLSCVFSGDKPPPRE